MSDEIERKVVDNYQEHELHANKPDPQCSDCYSELENHDCKLSQDSGCTTCELFSKYN